MKKVFFALLFVFFSFMSSCGEKPESFILPYGISYQLYEDYLYYGGFVNYGFCTPDGEILTHIGENYNFVTAFKSDDGFEYYIAFKYISENPNDFSSVKTFVIPKDGCWIIDVPEDSFVADVGTGMIVVCSYDTDDSGQELWVYGYDGNLIYNRTLENEHYTGMSENGIFRIMSSGGDKEVYYYKSADMSSCIGPYLFASDFKDGKAYVQMPEEMYCFIDKEGKGLSRKMYSYIDMVEKDGTVYYYAKSSDGKTAHILDNELKEVFSLSADGIVNLCIVSEDEAYCSYFEGENNIYQNIFDGTIVTSREFGVSPSMCFENGLFIYEGEKGISVFDGDGETVAYLEDCKEVNGASSDCRYISCSLRDFEYSEVDSALDKRKTAIFDTHTDSYVYIVDGFGYVEFLGTDDRFVKIETSAFDNGESAYYSYLFDTGEAKTVFEKCDNISYFFIDGKTFFHVVKDGKLSLYDENLNMIIQKQQ